MTTVSRDASSNVYAPASAAQWTQALGVAGITTGNPSGLWLLQEAAGDAADSIGSFTLTGGGGRTYQQAMPGWTRVGVKTTSGGQGNFKSTSASLPDISTTSALLLLYVGTVAAVATTRTLAQLGATFDGDTSARLNASEQIILARAGTETPGASVFCDATVRPVVIKVDRTNNASAVYTDQEKITGVAAGAGKTVMIGADNAISWDSDALTYMFGALFVAGAAEMTDAKVKTLLQTLGWTIPWS